MKIKNISIHVLRFTLKSPFVTSFGTYKELRRPFVTIVTKDGLVGFGEVPTLSDPAYKPESDTFSTLTSLEKFILPSLKRYQKINDKIENANHLRQSYAWIKGASFAKSGVEAAFWNIITQERRQPLWKIWGGTKKEFLVGVSIGGKNVDEVIEKANLAIQGGYKRLKIKVWPGVEEVFVKAVRNNHPNILLQVDANSSYDLSNWEVLKKLDNYGLLLIEQPLQSDDIVFHSEISEKLKTPICLDESIHSLEDAKRAALLWEKNENINRLAINIKPPRVSGFSEAITIAKYCYSKNIKTWIGGMLDSSWGKLFNLNLNTLAEISLPGDHFSPTGPYFEKDITNLLPQTKNGKYDISTDIPLNKRAFNQLGKEVFNYKFN